MNTRALAVPDDGPEGLYSRGAGAAREWWRVSLSERAHMFRIEHGHGEAGDNGVDIDTVVDLDNLEAKLLKWRREGFVSDADREDEALAVEAGSRFAVELQRAVELGRKTREAVRHEGVRIGNVDMPRAHEGTPSALVPRINDAYLFTARSEDIALDIVENRRVLLIGHTGSGKTSFIEQVAARTGHAVLRANMNGQTTIGDFVGFWTVKGGETVWVDGVLPVAMREGCWLIIDELDFAEPSILAVLTAVLEPNGRLLLKERGNEIVEPHASFRLFATANAAGAMSAWRHLYQGANLLNEAFLDRWRVYLFDYLSKEEEAEVLRRTLPLLTPAIARTLAAVAADCRAAFAREDLASAFSTRRLIDWAELMLRTGDVERAAGPAIYAKVSAEDAALIRSIIRHHVIFDAGSGAAT
ncbi:cobaltochelatase CobS [Paraburkholderia bannensis]|uniref:Cobaltochelatase CobS n=1 Tax=Paraburkholderia bannensis TaxID=765414 RepID=A0A7W9U2X7_9BURK|nr:MULTISPECIES: AAA family ATPase [Paraburkholderia]MBB3259815.1 cobaltochelatase CobS [Paraburkholderia sp. WP4_3_2]MBB6104875.1 cobaltochelatase CobS [Paraburkholderia bannensis]